MRKRSASLYFERHIGKASFESAEHGKSTEHLIKNGKPAIEHFILREHAERGALLRIDTAGGRLLQTCDYPHERAFARAVHADYAEPFTLVYREADAGKNDIRAEFKQNIICAEAYHPFFTSRNH